MLSANAVPKCKGLMHTAKQPEITLHGATFSSVCRCVCGCVIVIIWLMSKARLDLLWPRVKLNLSSTASDLLYDGINVIHLPDAAKYNQKGC